MRQQKTNLIPIITQFTSGIGRLLKLSRKRGKQVMQLLPCQMFICIPQENQSIFNMSKVDCVTFDSFEQLSVVGKGSYAKVVLAKKKEGDKLYAMKILKKKHIQKTKQQCQVMAERNILARISHPFIVKMHWSFQTEQKLVFVLDYCPGGELFGLLAKKHRLNEDQARFYAAQLVLALEYLHNEDILYRDLKPENVLIDRKGYLKLTDFGLSREKLESSDLSVCGTPEYLAPEIILKTGHSKEVDWWCLGCLIYEMVTGIPPFSGKSRTELFSKIVYEEPNIPVYISFKLKSLLQGLFKKSPKQRLGSSSVSQLKSHAWFQKINFQSLFSQSLPAPFLPHLKTNQDTSNFDTEFTSCDVDSSCGDNQEDGSYDRMDPSFNGFSFDEQRKRSASVQTQTSEEIEIRLE